MTLKKIFLRTPFNYDTNEASDETAIVCNDKTLTQQHFKEDADINVIVERFRVTGALPENVRMPEYADFEGIFDFQSAMNTIRMAEESFMAMDAKVRARFNNDPQAFLEFCSNKDNLAEARKLGLVPAEELPKPPAPPLKVEVVNPGVPAPIAPKAP